MGRNSYYHAHIKYQGEKRAKTFSVSKLSETGARLAASLQRLCWLIELGAWHPDSGDPLALLSYTDVFSGNQDYANAKVDHEESPYLISQQ